MRLPQSTYKHSSGVIKVLNISNVMTLPKLDTHIIILVIIADITVGITTGVIGVISGLLGSGGRQRRA